MNNAEGFPVTRVITRLASWLIGPAIAVEMARRSKLESAAIEQLLVRTDEIARRTCGVFWPGPPTLEAAAASSWSGTAHKFVAPTGGVKPQEPVTDAEYTQALGEVGETTPLKHRIEAACVVLTLGASNTGIRTLKALMHPDTHLQYSSCNREAAAILYLTLAGLLEAAPPAVSDQLLRTINEHSFSSAGLL